MEKAKTSTSQKQTPEHKIGDAECLAAIGHR